MQEINLSGSTFTGLVKAILDQKAAVRFKARGFSMSPFIRDGDILTVSPLTASGIRFGYVVFFLHPETRKAVVHRIIGRRKDLYFIKGDNTWDIDGLIPKSDILGRIIKIERRDRKVRFGLGPERFLIALLSQKKILIPLLFPGRIFARLCLRKDIAA